jgi:hypothetical protein
MKMNQISALARPLDINYRSNRNMLLVFLLVFLLGTALQWFAGQVFLQSLWWGARAAFVIFISWALGRELDPDINTTAMLVIPFSLASFYLYGDFNWLLLLAWLMMMRIGTHVCGQSVKLTDALLVTGLVVYLVWRGDHVIGFALTLVFLANYQLTPSHARSLWYAIVSFILSVLALIFSPQEGFVFSYDNYWMGGVIASGLLFSLLVIRDYKRPRSTEDYRVQALSGSRMQATQLIVLLGLIFAYILEGRTSVMSTVPLWATLIASVLVRIYQSLTRRSLA